jgi:c-di-GMP-binding flagellar brake protein YcgR
LDALAQSADTHRRAHPRFRVALPAAFQCYSQEGTTVSETVFRGRTVDISEGGLQVTGPLILGLDPDEIAAHPVKMVVTIGAVPQDIVGVCETRHVRLVRSSGGGTSCIYGLKVSQMSSTHRDILGSMIARIHRAQPQRDESTSPTSPTSMERN